MKIGLGSAVKEKVREMEENKGEGSSRRTRKEVLVCVQDLVENNKPLVQFGYSQKRDMCDFLL